MKASPGQIKFLYAFSVPPVVLLFSLIGANRWSGYGLFACMMVLAGAICASSLVHRRSNQYVTGIVYFVVLMVMVVFLP
jgi:hypothetical protein